MKVVGAAELAAVLDDRGLVERLREAFREGALAPPRHRHVVPAAGGDATLLLMPAWRPGGSLGVKVVTVFPGNASRGLSSVQAAYLLLDAQTGEPRAFMDGTMLTRRRTAAASALAADYLARRDSAALVMVGTGSMAPHLNLVHGRRPGRRSADEITLFKSVGAALEDLAAADMAYERLSR